MRFWQAGHFPVAQKRKAQANAPEISPIARPTMATAMDAGIMGMDIQRAVSWAVMAAAMASAAEIEKGSGAIFRIALPSDRNSKIFIS